MDVYPAFGALSKPGDQAPNAPVVGNTTNEPGA